MTSGRQSRKFAGRRKADDVAGINRTLVLTQYKHVSKLKT